MCVTFADHEPLLRQVRGQNQAGLRLRRRLPTGAHVRRKGGRRASREIGQGHRRCHRRRSQDGRQGTQVSWGEIPNSRWRGRQAVSSDKTDDARSGGSDARSRRSGRASIPASGQDNSRGGASRAYCGVADAGKEPRHCGAASRATTCKTQSQLVGFVGAVRCKQ